MSFEAAHGEMDFSTRTIVPTAGSLEELRPSGEIKLISKRLPLKPCEWGGQWPALARTPGTIARNPGFGKNVPSHKRKRHPSGAVNR
jgi:hypothetical protein